MSVAPPRTLQRHYPVFSAVAEQGVLVEFGDRIDRAINSRVRQLDQALARAPFHGFVESVPAYASLLVRFDPLICDHGQAETRLRALLEAPPGPIPAAGQRDIAVCYDADLAPDLAAVAAATGLSVEAVVAAHLAGDYSVFMYGFAPGYAYLAGVPDQIRLPRKPAALRGVAAGSVLIAGPQCLVSTLTMPTGWWVIGRSATRILTGDADRPFLFDVGDRVRFRRINRAEFDAKARA